MGSFTPLDVNKFNSPADVPQPLTETAVSVRQEKKSFMRGPLFLAMTLMIVFASGIFFAQQIFRGDSTRLAQGQEQPTPIPPTTAPKNIVVGIDATFAPMEYKDDNGDYVGFDVDLVKNIADELGANVQFENIAWDNIFDDLEAGKIDMIASSVSITDERTERFIFSQPYINAGQVVVTASGSAITKPEDMSAKKVGVQRGTTNESEAAKYTTDDLIIRYDDFQLAAQDLVDGKVDAILSDLPGAKGIISEHPELKISSDPFTNDFYGVTFKKDNTELRDAVDKALDSLRQKGVLNSLKEQWLN